jgi:hypothetical protein
MTLAPLPGLTPSADPFVAMPWIETGVPGGGGPSR